MTSIQNYFQPQQWEMKSNPILYSNSEEISFSKQPGAVWEHQEDDMGTLL